MEVKGETRHTFRVREDRKVDGLFYASDTFAFKETWTAADGRSFGLSANSVTKDVQAVPLGGSNYRFTFKQPGQPFVIRDSSGRIVAKDRGNITFVYTFDLVTEEFVPFDLRLSGPHPLFDLDLCKVVAPLAGTDSAAYLTAQPVGSTTFSRWALRVPSAELQRDGRQEPAARRPQRLWRERRRLPGALTQPPRTGIPRFIDIGGWPTDRPLVVLALQHVEEPPGFDFSPCDGRVGRLVQHAAPARPRQSSTGVLHDAGRGPRLHHLRRGPLQRRPQAGLPHRPVLRRIRDVGVPGEVRGRAGRGRGPDRRRRTTRVGDRRLRAWRRADLGIPRRARRRRRSARQHRDR